MHGAAFDNLVDAKFLYRVLSRSAIEKGIDFSRGFRLVWRVFFSSSSPCTIKSYSNGYGFLLLLKCNLIK